MVQYSKEFLQEYYDVEWLKYYDLISDEGYSNEEIDSLFQQAVSFELLKDKADEKRIALPATAYLKLDAHEKKWNKKAEKVIGSSLPLSRFQAPQETGTLFSGWSFHDCLILSVTVIGRTVEIRLNDVNAGKGNELITLRFDGASILENELPFDLKTYPGEGDLPETDYWWLYEEEVAIDRNKELHVLVEHGYEHLKLAVQYCSVERIDSKLESK